METKTGRSLGLAGQSASLAYFKDPISKKKRKEKKGDAIQGYPPAPPVHMYQHTYSGTKEKVTGDICKKVGFQG